MDQWSKFDITRETLYSLDLNIIENIWSLVSRRVYKEREEGGVQFDSPQTLIAVIESA